MTIIAFDFSKVLRDSDSGKVLSQKINNNNSNEPGRGSWHGAGNGGAP